MSWLRRNKNTNSTGHKETVFAKILDDLTTLEINTIIKKGMNAASPPEDIAETLKMLLDRYKMRMNRIVYHNSDVFDRYDDPEKDFSEHRSYKEFHDHLKECKQKLDERGKSGVRIEDIDYTRINRMLYFCNFIRERSTDEAHAMKVINPPGTGKTLYETDLYSTDNLKIFTGTRDRVKINRYYDLADERIVMQTRFGIDGDVVTRIEEDFSAKPKKLVLDIHNEHTNLSVNYWKSLIEIAKGIIFHD